MSDFIVAKTKQGFLNKLNAGEIPDKAVVFIEDFDEIYTHGKFYGSKYYDDGSGEVVPVKHPDLSTQPSILPYKFAGNYVYEQMVFVTSEQANNDFVTLVKFSDFGLKDGKKILLDYNIYQMGTKGGFIDIYGTLPFNIVTENDKIVLARVSGSETSDMWIRVVWTTEPNSGGYYYDYNAPESKYNFHIKGFEGLSFSIEGEPIDDSVKLPDNLVERFISGADITIDTGNESIGWVVCEETSESKDKTGSYLHAILFRHDDYYGVLSIEYTFPIAAERIQKGEKVTLLFKRA